MRMNRLYRYGLGIDTELGEDRCVGRTRRQYSHDFSNCANAAMA